MNDISFCPHCGSDLRPLAKPAVPAEQPGTTPIPRKAVLQRELTQQDIESLWGMMPFPAGIKPFGIVTDGISQDAISIAAESLDGKLWELAKGQVRMLDLDAPAAGQTVPQTHVCNAMSAGEKETLGSQIYGTRK